MAQNISTKVILRSQVPEKYWIFINYLAKNLIFRPENLVFGKTRACAVLFRSRQTLLTPHAGLPGMNDTSKQLFGLTILSFNISFMF